MKYIIAVATFLFSFNLISAQKILDYSFELIEK